MYIGYCPQEAQDLMLYAVSHRENDPEALWWSAEIASHLGFLSESRKFHARAVEADPSCAHEDYQLPGPPGGRPWSLWSSPSSK